MSGYPTGAHMIPACVAMAQNARSRAVKLAEDGEHAEAQESEDLAEIFECMRSCIKAETDRADRAEKVNAALLEVAAMLASLQDGTIFYYPTVAQCEAARAAIALATGERMSRRTDLWPVAIIEDRYGGVYSGGAWIAIADADSAFCSRTRVSWCLEDGPHGDDTDAMAFWADPPAWVAAGTTPDAARDALYVANPKLGAAS